MYVLYIICTSQGHVVGWWFGTSETVGDQRGRGVVECALCGSRDVAKAVMAPRVGPKGNRGGAATEAFSSDPEAVKAMMASIAETQKKMLEGSDFVGDRFADEARAIHLRSEEHPSELQSLMRISYAVFCLKKKKKHT